MKDKDISLGEAAAILEKPYYHVHRLIKKKILKARKIGWSWVLKRAHVEKHKAAQNS